MERHPIRRVEISQARVGFVWCEQCRRSIYDMTKDDNVQRITAEQARDNHSKAFTNPHTVIIMWMK